MEILDRSFNRSSLHFFSPAFSKLFIAARFPAVIAVRNCAYRSDTAAGECGRRHVASRTARAIEVWQDLHSLYAPAGGSDVDSKGELGHPTRLIR